MKLSRYLFAVTVVATLVAAGTSLGADYGNEVELSIAGLVSGDYGAYYERNLNGYFSVGGGGGYATRRELFVDVTPDITDLVDWTFGHGRVAGKLYPLGGFRRLFLQMEINAEFHRFKEKESGATTSVTTVWPAGLLGWRWIIAERATITLAGGSGYGSREDVTVGTTSFTMGAFRPRVDLNIGFLF